jgi:hypothetical protein
MLAVGTASQKMRRVSLHARVSKTVSKRQARQMRRLTSNYITLRIDTLEIRRHQKKVTTVRAQRSVPICKTKVARFDHPHGMMASVQDDDQ